MRISKRERWLVVLLAIVAVVVFMMNGDDTGAASPETATGRLSVSQLLGQYRHIHPLESTPAKQMAATTGGRNIFQYGSRDPGPMTAEAAAAREKARTEAEQAAADRMLEMDNAALIDPGLPGIDFELVGVVIAGDARAAVITREPELYLVQEQEPFLAHFVLKEVRPDGILVGYAGKEETTFIQLEKSRGF